MATRSIRRSGLEWSQVRVGAVLFVRSLRRIEALPLGMEPDRVVAVSARTSGMRITSAEVKALYERLLDAARSTPGMASAPMPANHPSAPPTTAPVPAPAVAPSGAFVPLA